MWDGPDGEGLGRAHVTRAVEDSLRRLQVDTIDLYQTHWPDEDVAIEETLTVLAELIAAGKVRHVGASNYSAAQFAESLKAGGEGRARYMSLQPHYNLVHRKEYEEELASLCEGAGIAVIPYRPLGGGFLTGKYRRGGPLPKGARSRMIMERATDQAFDVVDALDDVQGTQHNPGGNRVGLAPGEARGHHTHRRRKQRFTAPELLPASDLRLRRRRFRGSTG
jgi:aryl-alcohol dehydrogenase-like predicted oxidoreductase